MEIYYKSARFIDGKVIWVIIDKNNNIIRDPKNGFWSVPIDNDRFDTAIILCFDSKRENIDRAYAIPCEAIGDRKSISIVKNPSKGERWYEEFRIDEKPYNDLYHSVDIPRFFNPFDLWSGEYNGDKHDGASVE